MASVTQWNYITLCIVCVCVFVYFCVQANQSDNMRSSMWWAVSVCVLMALWCQLCTARGKQTGREEKFWERKRRQIWYSETVQQPPVPLPNYSSVHTCQSVCLRRCDVKTWQWWRCADGRESGSGDADRQTGLANGTACSRCDGQVIEVIGILVESCFPAALDDSCVFGHY